MARTEREPEEIISDLQTISEYAYTNYGRAGNCTGITHAVATLLTNETEGFECSLAYIDTSMKENPTVPDPASSSIDKKFTMNEDVDFSIERDEDYEITKVTLKDSGKKTLDDVQSYFSEQEPNSLYSCHTDDHSYVIYAYDADHTYLIDADQNIFYNIAAEPERWKSEIEKGGHFIDDEDNALSIKYEGKCLLINQPLNSDKRTPEDTFRSRLQASVTEGKSHEPRPEDSPPTPGKT
ncbi:MAG: hypothetical protein P1U40_11580 [Coxiellaceae bacterium]|nr:hypothetical protein [Coxiellaceae bacterium]